jgi:hypothetical protein
MVLNWAPNLASIITLFLPLDVKTPPACGAKTEGAFRPNANATRNNTHAFTKHARRTTRP